VNRRLLRGKARPEALNGPEPPAAFSSKRQSGDSEADTLLQISS
jgi:hypothetical protein